MCTLYLTKVFTMFSGVLLLDTVMETVHATLGLLRTLNYCICAQKYNMDLNVIINTLLYNVMHGCSRMNRQA